MYSHLVRYVRLVMLPVKTAYQIIGELQDVYRLPFDTAVMVYEVAANKDNLIQ